MKDLGMAVPRYFGKPLRKRGDMDQTNRIADSLARIWDAIESSTLEDIPTIAKYIADNLEVSRVDKATIVTCMVAGYAIGVFSGILLVIACR
jgi:N-glycosylase/DNA lyase